MGNQVLCNVVLCVMLLYVGMCLCIIGRPSLAEKLLRQIRHAVPSFLSKALVKRLQQFEPGEQAQTR